MKCTFYREVFDGWEVSNKQGQISSLLCEEMRNSVTLCKIHFLQSASADRLRRDWSHFKVLSVSRPVPPQSLGRESQTLGLLGLLSTSQPEARSTEPRCVTCCVYNLSCCSLIPQPLATPLPLFPASSSPFLPPFVSRAGFHATGCLLGVCGRPAPHTTALRPQSLATSLPPAHPDPSSPPVAAVAAPNSPPNCPFSLPLLPPLLFTQPSFRFCPVFSPWLPRTPAERGKGGIGEESSSHGLSGDVRVTQRIRTIHMI